MKDKKNKKNPEATEEVVSVDPKEQLTSTEGDMPSVMETIPPVIDTGDSQPVVGSIVDLVPDTKPQLTKEEIKKMIDDIPLSIVKNTNEQIKETLAKQRVDTSHPAYREIEVIISQWNFKHGTHIKLNGHIIEGAKGFPHIEMLKKDLAEWYSDITFIETKEGNIEVIL